MQPQQNVSLQDHSTMRLGGSAAYLCEVTSRQEVVDALNWAKVQNLPVIMIGGGSNIIWRDEGFPGLVIVNSILRYEEFVEDELNHYLTIGAGENWDSVVARTVEAGLSGIECLSLIPGKTGATPVQNVGAYGQDISQTLVSVEAYDNLEQKFVNVPNIDCQFGYRTSRFKTTDRGRFFITAITLHLTKTQLAPPLYASLQKYLDDRKLTDFSPQALREAVIAIRNQKLPDPAQVANNGSFFANPIVDPGTYTQIQSDCETLVPHWDVEGGIKLSAAWLIEQAGFSDMHDQETGMATWAAQPLVFVNESATTTSQLLAFRQKVLDSVRQKFGVDLQQEPELLP